jgi:orotidine-5'-phosphate decarboxylase
VGLDPDFHRIEKLYGPAGASPAEVCMRAMMSAASAAAGYAAAFKPNASFFEAVEESEPLMVAMGRHLAQEYPDIIAITDAKRGDIGNSAAQYAKAVFDMQRFDCVTVNPLMGHDAVEPFVRDPARGVFLLCLTSNPGADDFLLVNDMYLRIAEKAMEWNTNNNVGLVVGATRPEYLGRVREIAPDLPLLIPGVGAQGGKLKETLDAIGARENRRFLINASRAVLYPPNSRWETYAGDVANAARELRDDINRALK